jgi:hypothetical protein
MPQRTGRKEEVSMKLAGKVRLACLEPSDAVEKISQLE